MADVKVRADKVQNVEYDSRHDIKLYKMIRMGKSKREIQAVLPVSEEELRYKHGELQQIDERYYKCEGLYEVCGKIMMEDQGIGIPKSRLASGNFQIGDEFDITINPDDNTIILKKNDNSPSVESQGRAISRKILES